MSLAFGSVGSGRFVSMLPKTTDERMSTAQSGGTRRLILPNRALALTVAAPSTTSAERRSISALPNVADTLPPRNPSPVAY